MKPITINPEYNEQRMSTAKGFSALQDHTQEELVALAIQAKKSKNPTLLRCFLTLPKLSELLSDKITFEQAQLTHRKPDDVIAAEVVEEEAQAADEIANPEQTEVVVDTTALKGIKVKDTPQS